MKPRIHDVFAPMIAIPLVQSGRAATGTWKDPASGSTLTWTAVPEPRSALAGLLIAAGLLLRRR